MKRVLVIVVLAVALVALPGGTGRGEAAPLRIPEIQRRTDSFGTDLRRICEGLLARGPLEVAGTVVPAPSPPPGASSLASTTDAEARALAGYLNGLRAICAVIRGHPSAISALPAG
ncbi:MAG: hypothetical protein K8M05_03470, partial [Deltaproteobacteria bacterium]|nr:hypothetical protein [Kofleriaceae bacterium]